MANKPTKGKGAPSGASFNDLSEIGLVLNATRFGEIDALLDHFIEHGLNNRESRKFVANLARGDAQLDRRRLESRAAYERNTRVQFLVANRIGLLARQGKDRRRAFTMVAEYLQRMGDGLDRKQVKRIWEQHSKSWTLKFAFELGRDDGIEVTMKADT